MKTEPVGTFELSLANPANLVGWFGGAIISNYTPSIALEPEKYFDTLRRFTKFKDVLNGLEKAEIFGFVVVLVSCSIGLATRGGPVPAVVKVEKVNPTVEVIAYDTVQLSRMGEEKTAVRFRLAADGSVVDVNHREKSLIQLTRNVRRTTK